MDDDEEIAVDSEDEVAADSDDEAATDSDDDVVGDSHDKSIYHSPIPLGASIPLHEPGVGTGRVIPTKFEPPNLDDTPQSLFPLGISVKRELPAFRFINNTDESQVLLFTDGACLGNGSLNP